MTRALPIDKIIVKFETKTIPSLGGAPKYMALNDCIRFMYANTNTLEIPACV